MTRKLTSLMMAIGMAGGALFQANGCNVAITPIEEEAAVTSTAGQTTPTYGQYPAVWTTNYFMSGWGGY